MRRALQIGLIVTAVCAAVTPLPRGVVERVYSRAVYPAIQPKLTTFSNHTAIALFDVTLLSAVAAVLWAWIVRFRRTPRGTRLKTAGFLILDTVSAVALIYLWFLVAWGLNYQREPIRTHLDFQEDRITVAALHNLALQDADAMNRLYEPAHRKGWTETRDAGISLYEPFAHAQRDLAMPWRVTPGRPKRSLIDFYFRRVAVDGMTDPFFLETLANQGLLPFERPFVVAHEWGHLAGYADESEANFLAWLICQRGEEPDEYSAWISLYGTIQSGLPPADRESVVGRLQAGPRADLKAMAERMARQVNPAASRAGYAVYDRFLKANRVQAGVRSYNEVLRLLLGTRFHPDGSPALR